MPNKYTSEQKRQLKELRKQMANERKYIPRGQGDGINSHLAMSGLAYDIKRVKEDPEYVSSRVSRW